MLESDVYCIEMAKTELLKNVSLFSKLGPNEIDIVAAHSEYYTYGEGEYVFEEGSVHDELYIIKRGEIVVRKSTEGGRTVDVARYVAGECFGELAMLDSKPRTATAIAAEETELLIFPERNVTFRELLQRHPVIFAQILHKLLAIVAGRIRSTNALISEKSPLVQALRSQLLSDELTGLYNRTFLEEDFVQMLVGYGAETSVLMVKPDNFKAINDTYGHEAGDGVLKLLADTISAHIDGSDVAVRYRGNEIAVILPGQGEEVARERAESIRSAVERLDIAPIIGGDRMPVTASVGVVLYPRDATVASELIECAFATMWEAREAGGNRVSVAKAVAR